ncbi:MAG: zinc-binding alcohol dehydrogenase [Anaerolineae bacterium]|nr:zinc-binding alcohol dehydrogenase [Anaerolineae bacterium]
MKEFIVAAPSQIEFRDYTDLPLGPTDVRIRSIVSGIKHGTEMALYRGRTPFLTKRFDMDYRMFMPEENHQLYPMNLGSWLTGEVIEVGSAVTRFKVGDKVHGGMKHRPTNVISEDSLYPLADGMKPETALFTDPAIFALGAVHDARIKVGDRVAIFGMGALGLLAVQIARMNGAETIFAVDTIDARLDLAKAFGADAVFNAGNCDPAFEIKQLTNKKGVDVVIEISGAYPALQAAIRAVHVCGLIVGASYYSGEQPLELGAEWHHNRPTFISSMPVWGMPHRCYPMWDLKRTEQTALHLLETGRLNTQPMIGRSFQYNDAAEAYQFIDQHPEASLKTLLYYNDTL